MFDRGGVHRRGVIEEVFVERSVRGGGVYRRKCSKEVCIDGCLGISKYRKVLGLKSRLRRKDLR
jgi:hypothetical protein